MLRLALLIATSCGAPGASASPPPAPPAPEPATPGDNLGAPVAAAPDPAPPPASPASPVSPRDTHRILSIRLAGGELELVVDGGAHAGIRKEWSATLIDASDRVVPVKLRITTVAEDRTVVLARATRDQVTGARVRLSPPN